MNYILTTLVFFVGVFLPIQVGVNAELAKYINSPILAALVSFLVGGMCLILGAVVFKVPLPSFSQVTSMPIWLWGGGMIGALVVLGSILAGPKIGALALVSLLLAGQLVASILIDHYGWLGFPVQKM
ncbi:DMT family transporter, partial [Nitrospinaceae bacterium]|nr:DMT family transporter [Nitrospinaceae bacterium]